MSSYSIPPEFPSGAASPPAKQPLYGSGDAIQVGDRMEMVPGATGTVVHVAGSPDTVEGFPIAAWEDLEVGFLVREADGVLMQYKTALPTMRLLARRDD